jgi:AraC family transcriptional regulator
MKEFQIMGLSGIESGDLIELAPGNCLTRLWHDFYEKGYNAKLCNQGQSHYQAQFWQIGAYDFHTVNNGIAAIIGAQYKGGMPEGIDFDIKTIPAATWAVFSINSNTGNSQYHEAYTRIITEWFPASPYKRDEGLPNLDVYPDGDVSDPEYTWEIWIPIQQR